MEQIAIAELAVMGAFAVVTVLHEYVIQCEKQDEQEDNREIYDDIQ